MKIKYTFTFNDYATEEVVLTKSDLDKLAKEILNHNWFVDENKAIRYEREIVLKDCSNEH